MFVFAERSRLPLPTRSVRYRLMLATSSSTIMIVYSRLTRQGVDDGGSSTARQQMESSALPEISPSAEGAV